MIAITAFLVHFLMQLPSHLDLSVNLWNASGFAILMYGVRKGLPLYRASLVILAEHEMLMDDMATRHDTDRRVLSKQALARAQEISNTKSMRASAGR